MTVFLRRPALALLALGLLPACSDSDETLLSSRDALPLGGVGRLSLPLVTGGVDVDRLHYILRNAGGSVVRDGTLELDEPGPRVELDVPASAGYALTLLALGPGGVECSGAATFDVVAGVTLELPVELVCEATGRVAVTGTLLPPGACPSVTLAALEDPVGVGSSVQLRAAAEPGADTGPSFAWASSGGALEGALTHTATFTCTEPGPVTLTLTADLDGCVDTASTVVECVAASHEGTCASLASNCHVVDPGSGPLHECHELAHAGDENACSEQHAACVDGCGTELCSLLGSFCHPVDPGSGPLHECHELAHAGDAAACFARGRECYDLCAEARARASEPITLQFAGRVGGEPFACGQTYAAVGSSSVPAEPRDFRFFVSEVRLLDATGAEHPVELDTRAPWQAPEVGLIDFEDQSGACVEGTPAMNTVLTGRVLPGEYVGIVFELGVPQSLNHDDPALAPAPLELGTMSWGWLLGYRFLRAEMASLGDEETPPATALLHLGSTSCTGNPYAGTLTCANGNRSEVRLNGFDPTKSVIVADLAALFAETDLTRKSLCHSTEALCAGPFAAAGVDLATGEPLPDQTLFRIE